MNEIKRDKNKIKPLYLDYQATTPMDPRVLDKMLPFFSGQFGNVSEELAGKIITQSISDLLIVYSISLLRS